MGQTVYRGNDYTSAADFAAALDAAIESASTMYAAGTDLSTVGDDALTISWEWPFDGDDQKDTALGNNAANPYRTPADINIEIHTTVTQID